MQININKRTKKSNIKVLKKGKRKEVLKKSLPKTVLRINKAITKDKPINTGIQTPIKRAVLAAANWKAVFLKTDL